MVRLRLRRVGRKKQPSYRIVAAEKEAPRDGRFLEIVGFYNPRTQPETINLKEDRIYHWLSKGAQPSDSVARILKTAGAMDRYERFKAGEDVEKLVAEAEAAEETRSGSPKTRRDGDAPKKAKKAEAEEKVVEKAKPAEEAPAAEEAVEAEAVEEAPAAEEAVEEEAPAEEPAAEEAVEEEAPAEEPAAEEAVEEEAPAEAEAPAEEAPAAEEAAEEASAEEAEESEE